MSDIYHVLSRGVDKRKIFLEDKDYLRFIHDLFEFNDDAPVSNVGHFFSKGNNMRESGRQYIDLRSRYIGDRKRKERSFLVNVLAFCLMPNHYHLLLSPQVEGGVTKFMRKLNIGYAKYFNQKNERVGTLFEGRYKSVLVKDDAHLIHLPFYIHLNPLDLKMPEWRERELKSSREAMKFLSGYKWSSFLDYVGEKNFPSVTQREFLLDFFDGEKEYERATRKWLREMDLGVVRSVMLE